MRGKFSRLWRRRDLMDMNYILRRHQIELMMADAAASEASRDAHLMLADCYSKLIENRRKAAGLGVFF